MANTTILEKLKIIYEVSASSKIFIAVIAFIGILAIIALTTNKRNIKRIKNLYATLYLGIAALIIILFHDSLGKMFDYMMNNFFIAVYFPNVAIYLAAIIITNIILCCTIFNLKTSKLIKTINITAYSIIHYLLALVLSIIKNNELDVFEQTSIYGNKSAQALIELSSAIFMVWLVFLTFYKIIRHYQLKGEKEPLKSKVIVKKVRKLPDNIIKVQAPVYVQARPKKEKQVEILTEEPVIIKDLTEEKNAYAEQIEEATAKLKMAEEKIRQQETIIHQSKINNDVLKAEQIKLQYEQTELAKKISTLESQNRVLKNTPPKAKPVDATTAIMQSLDNVLTLEDYKVLATILKEKQKRQKETTEKVAMQIKEQLKFEGLQETYKNTR